MNKILAATIAIVMGIVLLGSALMPVIEENTEKTHINASDTRLDTFGGEVSGSVDLASGIVIEVNGQPITHYASSNRITILTTDTFRLGIDGASSQGVLDYWNGTTAAHLTNSFDKATFTVANNVATITYTKNNADTTVTLNYADWGFVIANEGKYADVTAYNGGTIYYDDVSEVYSGYYTYTNGYWYSFHGNSAKVNGADATLTNTATGLDGSGGYSATIGYNASDLVVSFEVASVAKEAKVFNVIVPYKVTVELDNDLGLLNVIPILIVVALLMCAVRIITGRNN